MAAAMRRFNLARMGRRWGKTVLGIDYLLDDLGGMPGAIAGEPVGWFAPSYKYLNDPWRETKRLLRRMIRSKSEIDHRLDLWGGGSIEFWTLDVDDPGRGRKYRKVVVDEAAIVRGLLDKWNAAIRPTLSDLRGGALFASTPKGHNDFWKLHQQAKDRPEWAVFHAPTVDNPYIAHSEVEAARLDLPERIFAQEYEAAFLDDGGGVFRHVLDAVDEELPVDPHEAHDVLDGRAMLIGVDWGRHNDFTVLSVVDAKRKALLALDRFTQIDYAIQLARLKALHQRFPRAPIIAESNSMGEPLIEQLRRDDLPVRSFQTTAASKAAIIESLALAFERREIRIPKIPALIDELMAFDQERLPSGAIRYGAPDGQHDDCVMSLAIAWHGLAWATGPTVASAGTLETAWQ